MNHVIARQMKPVSEVPEVNGLLPLECTACGAKAYLGLPLAVSTLVTLTQAMIHAHADCEAP